MAIKFLHNISQWLRRGGQQDVIDEGRQETKELLTLSMDNDELVKEINRDIEDAMPLYQKMKQVWQDNEQYYLGEQLNTSFFTYELPMAENLLYARTENRIAMITAKRREPIVLPAQDNDESKTLAKKTQQFLTWKWHEQDMSIKFEDWVRHAEISPLAVLKIRFDKEKDDFEIENVRTERIMIDKNATNEYDAKFIVQFKEDKLSDLTEMFPEAKERLTKEFGDKLGTRIKYLEYWTNEFVVWKVNQLVISKKKNPYWNWSETDRKKNLETLRKKWIEKAKEEKLENLLLNYFDQPRKPFILLSLKNLNETIYSATSDFEQAKVAQDILNKRKRQIDKHAQHALGRVVISGQLADITKAEANKIVANPNAPLWVGKGRATDAVSFIAPQPISPIILQDMQDSKNNLDDIMSVHGTTRGERGPQETATGRTILREGDLGRLDLSVRRIDKKLELAFAWMMQMVKVFYTEEHFVKILGQEGASTYLKFSQDDIEDGQEVLVKSEITADKATQRQGVTDRMQAGLLDPLTYFEKFDEPNPKELTRRLVYYLTDPKLYVQQFAIDENTPGAENDPLIKAKQENDKMMTGEVVPPFQGATQDHIQEHAKLIETNEFKNQEVDIQQNVVDHIRQETEILKQLTKSI